MRLALAVGLVLLLASAPAEARLRSVSKLTATTKGSTIRLHWKDRSGGETRYEVRVRGTDGKERSRTFRTKKEAERYERAHHAAIDSGVMPPPAKRSARWPTARRSACHTWS